MKTDELVAMLAQPPAGSRRPILPRLGIALSGSMLTSALLMLLVLGLRPDLTAAARLPMFWVKLGYPTLVAIGTLAACWRLAHPGQRLDRLPAAILLPVLVMTFFGAAVLVTAPSSEQPALLFGTTWQACLLNIAWLSLPVFTALAWGMRHLAPTRERLAGGTCGLAAGALAAVLYALHCPELEAPFIAVWYLLGMLIPAAAGAALGKRLFGW
jgi:hypothetical protein